MNTTPIKVLKTDDTWTLTFARLIAAKSQLDNNIKEIRIPFSYPHEGEIRKNFQCFVALFQEHYIDVLGSDSFIRIEIDNSIHDVVKKSWKSELELADISTTQTQKFSKEWEGEVIGQSVISEIPAIEFQKVNPDTSQVEEIFNSKTGITRCNCIHGTGEYKICPIHYPRSVAEAMLDEPTQRLLQEQEVISNMLEERKSNYGNFKEHAEITQELKRYFLHDVNVVKLSDSQLESLEMILHKIGRIINGNPNYVDSWQDIAGYAQLIVNELNDNTKQFLNNRTETKICTMCDKEFQRPLGALYLQCLDCIPF